MNLKLSKPLILLGFSALVIFSCLFSSNVLAGVLPGHTLTTAESLKNPFPEVSQGSDQGGLSPSNSGRIQQPSPSDPIVPVPPTELPPKPESVLPPIDNGQITPPRPSEPMSSPLNGDRGLATAATSITTAPVIKNRQNVSFIGSLVDTANFFNPNNSKKSGKVAPPLNNRIRIETKEFKVKDQNGNILTIEYSGAKFKFDDNLPPIKGKKFNAPKDLASPLKPNIGD